MPHAKHSQTPSSLRIRSQSLASQCRPDPQLLEYPRSLRAAEDIIYRLQGPSQLVARIQMASGARAQEILSLTWADVHAEGWIYVEASKGSIRRAVYVGELIRKHPALRRAPELRLFGSLTYQKYYRLVKAAAGARLRRTAVRLRVTNLFRVAAAELARCIAHGNPEAAQHLLGHKSGRSTRYYLKPERNHHG